MKLKVGYRSLGLVAVAIMAGAVLSLRACRPKSPWRKEPKIQMLASAHRVTAPSFDAERAYRQIEVQVALGPRFPGSVGHEHGRRHLLKHLGEIGLEPQQQRFEARAFDGTKLALTNVLATVAGKTQQPHILLAAHWDTRPFADKDTERRHEPILGANDGASGVAVLLEIARLMTAGPAPRVGVDFVFFDGEDYGAPKFDEQGRRGGYCLGSRHWAQVAHDLGYSARFGVLLDMVGASGARFYREGRSRKYAADVGAKLWAAAHYAGFEEFFVYEDSPWLFDDHAYMNKPAGIPSIDIVEFNPSGKLANYHHTHRDNMNIIDRDTLLAVGQTVLNTIYNE